jgi:hypothetical protein
MEDLVQTDVFVNAVNEELRRSHGEGTASLVIANVSSPGRWRSLERWCQAESLAVPNKGAVVHRIADQRHLRPLVSAECVEILRGLHTKLAQLLSD